MSSRVARKRCASIWLSRPVSAVRSFANDGVVAGFQLRPLPYGALEVEQIIEEHHLAAIKAEFAVAQVQAARPALGAAGASA